MSTLEPIYGHDWPQPADPGPADNAALDDAYEARLKLAQDVSEELHRLRVRKAAQDALRAQNEPSAPPFDAGTLAELLARPVDPPARVEGLVPWNSGTLLVAQRKTGKTTCELNLARCLLTGEDFLGRFGVRAVDGNVTVLNFEVSPGMLARWADEHGLDRDRFRIVNLRGRRNPFSHPEGDLVELAGLLRSWDTETLIVDPFGRAYNGRSQDDNGEVGAWLVRLDQFARGHVGARDIILAVHAGWNGERSRGASALEDWADSVITLTRDPDDERLRFLRAEGRDVDVDEDRLDYDPVTRTLTLAGTGSRKQARTERHLDELLPAVLGVVRASPGVTGYGLDMALREAGETFRKGDGAKAARLGVDRGQLRIEPGPRNSQCFHPLTSPTSPPPPRGEVTSPPPPPVIGEVGGEGGEQASPPQPEEVVVVPAGSALHASARRCDCGTPLQEDGICLRCRYEAVGQ